MRKEKVKITIPLGLHFRPAGVLCEEAMKYKCDITFKVHDTIANMKSFLSILAACVKCDDEIEIICNGIDEEVAINNIIDIIKKDFVK